MLRDFIGLDDENINGLHVERSEWLILLRDFIGWDVEDL
jgi:hypothetical protein